MAAPPHGWGDGLGERVRAGEGFVAEYVVLWLFWLSWRHGMRGALRTSVVLLLPVRFCRHAASG